MLRWIYAVAAMCSMVGAGHGQERDEENSAPAECQMGLRLWYGDPQGNRQQGTLKSLAEPKLVTQFGRSATFTSGGWEIVGDEKIFFGYTIRMMAEIGQNEMIRVSVQLEHTEKPRQAADVVHMRTTKTQYFRTVNNGDTIRVTLGKEGDFPVDKQTWLELQVHKVEPQ